MKGLVAAVTHHTHLGLLDPLHIDVVLVKALLKLGQELGVQVSPCLPKGGNSALHLIIDVINDVQLGKLVLLTFRGRQGPQQVVQGAAYRNHAGAALARCNVLQAAGGHLQG